MATYTGQTTGTQEGDIAAGYIVNGAYLPIGAEVKPQSATPPPATTITNTPGTTDANFLLGKYTPGTAAFGTPLVGPDTRQEAPTSGTSYQDAFGGLTQPVQQPPTGQPQVQGVQQGGQAGQQNQPAGQPQVDQNGQPIPDATIGQNGQAPVQVGGRFGTQQFGRLGGDVYEIMSDGSRRKVTEAEFNQKLRAQGLNLEALPQLDLENLDDTPAGPPAPDVNADGTPKGPTDFATTYANTIKELGLTDIKAEFEKTKKEFEDLQRKKNEESVEIDDNPWLSENQRRGKQRKLDAKYELNLNTLTNQMKIYESLYEQGLEQAKFITSGIMEDQNKALDRALKREEALAKLLEDGGGDYDLREIDGSLYRIDKNTGKTELLIKGSPTGSGGLTSAQINSTINQIAGSFDNEQIVKDYNSILAQVNFVKTAGTTPTDDISRVYAFAKVMDPTSVVREGEYKTVQDYSQALLQQFGLRAERVFTNTGFLTPEARTFLQNTLQRRLTTSQQQYDNLRTSYQQRISDAQSGGYNSLTNYGGAFPADSPETELINDISLLASSGKTREQIADELFRDYGSDGFTRDEIYFDYVLKEIPDR